MNKRLGWGIGLVTLAGLALRLWKLSYGLPHIIFSDEGHHIYWALNMGGGDFNPHQFVHPTFFFYLCFAADCLYTLWGLATGLFDRAGDAWRLYKNDPTVFYLIGRLWSVFFGTLTIPLVYFTGKRIFNATVGFWAALFVAFSLLHVQYSQIAYLDVPLTFFILLSFFLAYLGFENGRVRYFVLSGIAGGLATSVKYNGLSTVLFGPVASLLLLIRGQNRVKAGSFLKVNFLFFIFLILGFTLGTPYWPFDFYTFKIDVLNAFLTYDAGGAGQLGYDGGRNWLYYVSNPLHYGLNPAIEWAAIAGFCVLLWQRTRKDWLFTVYPLVYFAVIGLTEIRGVRYAIPLIPFMGLSAAYVIDFIANQSRAGRVGTRALLVGVAGFFLVLPSVRADWQYARLKSVPDTRAIAADWIRNHIPKQSGILVSSYLFLPDLTGSFRVRPLDSTLFDSRLFHVSSLKDLDQYRKEGWDYLVLDEWHQGIVLEGADRSKYREQFQKYEALAGDLKKSAQLIETFSPYRQGSGKFNMENIDLPSRAIGNFRSMGPTVWIYKLSKA